MHLRHYLLTMIFLCPAAFTYAQPEQDTALRRCPVFITDTVSANNFFIEGLPSNVKLYRVKGKLTLEMKQKDQYFTIFFHDKKLKSQSYNIERGSNGKKEVEARYSFRSGSQVSFVDVSRGKMEVTLDEEKKIWHLKVNGMLANMVERSVTWYRVKAEFILNSQ
jgi:hypothetical protein